MMMKVASSMLKSGPSARPLAMCGTQKNFATLVLAEHFEGKLSPTLGSVLTAAGELNDT